MSEAKGDEARSRPSAFSAHLSGEARGGWFRPDRLLLDCAGGGWLAYGFAVFRGHEGVAPVRFALAFGLLTGLSWCLCGGHGRWRHWRGRLGGGLALVVLLALPAPIIAARTIGDISGPAACWLAGAASLIGVILRLALRKLYPQPGWPSLGEALRWVVLLAAATWSVQPFYTHRPIGAGDAYWYTLMLSDFIEQTRLGQFPVWTGVTEFAFNGTVSPLRLAPWFQHLGGLLDLLTVRSLEYACLKNLVLITSQVATAASAYAFLRAIMFRQPSVACVVVLVCLASPALLAPLYVGDQYMTFLAMPFLPAVYYGLWRAMTHNDYAAHAILGGGAAGLWLAHPPIALWTGGLGALAFLGKLAWHRHTPGEAKRIALAAIVFALLGAYPLLSALSLDNTSKLLIRGDAAAAEIAKAFPANFLPLSKTLDQQSDYQAGYAALAVLALALGGMPFRRPPAAVLLSAVALLMLLIMLPVPFLTGMIWHHMPSAVMQATNNWPMQRLFPIWTVLLAFVFAAVHREREAETRGRFWLLFFIVVTPLLAWSGYEAGRFIQKSRSTIPSGSHSNVLVARHNVLLTRYSFVSFAYTPSYFSHGYMDPVLEHRLLRPDFSPLLTNKESAVRRGMRPAPDPEGDARLAAGTWHAVNDNHRPYYLLEPKLRLPAQQHLALWLEPLVPGEAGWLQISGLDLFREYILPDSGTGTDRRLPARAFGTLPTSSRIIPLFTQSAPALEPRLNVIAPDRPISPGFDFARFELWRYDPATLPVAVKSWVPYRVTVDSPEPAYLETPRMWLGGYRAKINGQRVPVERSPDNLAMFRVPAGHSDVTIKYVPSLLLEIVYWACLVAWCSLLLAGFVTLLAGRIAEPPPESSAGA